MSVHGTRVRYIQGGCRCDACREASTRYERDRRRRIAEERWNPERSRYVDGDIVRAHLADLARQGMGMKRAAATAGVAHGTASAILYGKHADDPSHPDYRIPRRRVRRDIAEALLAVTYEPAGWTIVDGTGTARRLQALMAIGWSGTRLAERLGVLRTNFTEILHGRRGVHHATAHAVRALYDELWDVAPPAATTFEQGAVTRTLRFAQQHGWVPPMAWDDETIDDPAARPSVGDAGTVSMLDTIRELADLGYSLPEIAARIGRRERSIRDYLLARDRATFDRLDAAARAA